MLKTSLTAGLMAALAAPAMAGGIVIADEVEVVQENSSSSIGILPLILLATAIVVITNDDPEPRGSRP